MSLKNMAVKMALAFAAAKGAEAFRDAGGMDGIRRKLSGKEVGRGGGIGGSGRGGSQTGGAGGGIGGMLRDLGISDSTNGKNNSLGGLLGSLAGASAGSTGATRMKGLLDTTRETAEGTPEEEQVSGLMIRAMIQAAKADGEIDAQERATLREMIAEASPQEMAFVQRMLDAPVSADSLARDTPNGHEIEVYTASVVAITPDNRREAEYLDQLARALKIDRRTVNEIHEAQGKQPLYTL